MDMRMELESYVQSSPNTKRFVVEDSITKVTSDGEPHGMMTMVAGLSGLLAAIIILAVLASMVACRKQKSTNSNDSDQNSRKLSKKSMNVAMTIVEDGQPQPKLAGNLNAAFAESTLTLQGREKDKEKDSQWSTTPTSVVVERY